MSDLVQDFLTAQSALEAERRRWNALTQEQRVADKFGYGLNDSAKRAAQALLADAWDRHTIEETAKVYLVLGPDGWRVDRTSYGQALEGYENGPLNEACECDDRRECDALRQAAEYLDLPDGAELIPMLQADLA